MPASAGRRRSDELRQRLDDLYYNVDRWPQALASVRKLQGLAARQNLLLPPPPMEIVRDYLHGEHAYTKHRPAVRRAVRRNRTLAAGIGTMFQADLADVQRLARYNHGARFLLCVIDVFSKRAWVRALRRKTGGEVRDALQSIWNDPVMPPRRPTTKRMNVVLATDAGKEFLNEPVQRWLAERNIEHRTLQGDHKAAVVERFQRTLKERLHRLMTARGGMGYKYADKLRSLVTGYNGSHHRTLGMRPLDVRRGSRERLVHHRQYLIISERQELTRRPRDDLRPGDTVKISESEHQTFRKGYVGYWRDELFRVTAVLQGVPNKQYTIESVAGGEPIQGAFYREQLLKVEKEK